ncbi:MAG: hypothetical protein JNIBNLAF_02115 [Nitrosomonas europaea]|uniref:PEP-CTERM sorting domain-containing protein n=3 Tax=Nitrosomonas TaxID=914 RepID=UPI0023F37F50|nr:PEP-CTERM sorting domain-containing protein [Nitrosomonas europaea]MBV6390424.1 hypothetical protein [Nitrosomonas europaea]
MKNNNQLVYTGVSLVAMLAFGQVTQAAPLILGGNQTISTDTVVESVVIGNTGAGPTGGDGSLTVNSGAALINNGNGTFIGNIEGVNPQRGHGYIGLNAGSTGVATITGANSLWQNQNRIYVGFNGQGTLNIADGGKVSGAGNTIGHNAGSTGIVTVTGAGSLWQTSGVNVGNSGQGTLAIQNGGKVSSAGNIIGNNLGSTGNVTVTGMDSLWESSAGLSVNRGTLDIENGGKVTNVFGSIGSSTSADTAAIVTITGQNSLWQNSTTLHVGNRSQGTLNVQDGGKVTNTNGYIGASDNHIGTVTVTGANSLWQNSDFLNIGATNGGQGTLNIDDGGVVSATNGVAIWSTGSLSGNGGTLDGDVINHGLISLGSSSGAGGLAITGDLSSDGTLAFDIFGPTVYDQLFIGGDFTIDGLLTLDFSSFLQPVADTFYDLIHVGGNITGTWGNFDDIQFLNTFTGFNPGLLAYSIVDSGISGYGQTLRLTVAGIGDTGNPGEPGDNTVPEPASGLLIGLGGLAMLFFRRRRSQV